MLQDGLDSEGDISLEPFNRECMLFPTYAKRNPDKSSEWIVQAKGWAYSHNSSTTKQKMMMSITRSVAGKSSADQTSSEMFEERFKYFFANNKRNKEFIIQAVGTIKDNNKESVMGKLLDNLAEPLIEFDDYKTDHLDWTTKDYFNQKSAVSPSSSNQICTPALTEKSTSSFSATNSIHSAECTDSDDVDDEGFDEDRSPEFCQVRLKTKNSGFLSGQFSIPHDNILNWAQQQNQRNARLIRIQSVCTDGNKFSRNHGIVNLIEPTGISVISDIDDTIKDTKVLSGARAVLSKTFFEEPQSVDGMADAYMYWYSHGVSFHYVSNSPFQLMPMLDSFIAESRFPSGSMHLRTDGSLLSRLVEVPGLAKREAILEILRDFPQRQFILVGDSGEIDLEIYTRLALEFPNQILKIFIRDVTTPVILARSSINNSTTESFEKKRSSTFASLFPKKPITTTVLSTSPQSSSSFLFRDNSVSSTTVETEKQQQQQQQQHSSIEKLKKFRPAFGIKRAMTATLAELSSMSSSGDSQPSPPKPLHRAATTPSGPESNSALEACAQLYDRVRRAQLQIPDVGIVLFEDPAVLTKDVFVNERIWKYTSDDTFDDSAYDETSPAQPSSPILHSI